MRKSAILEVNHLYFFNYAPSPHLSANQGIFLTSSPSEGQGLQGPYLSLRGEDTHGRIYEPHGVVAAVMDGEL